jgi:hypothetical protein
MKDNEMRHVIHDTRISSGQCPRRDVTVRYGIQGHTKKTSGRTYTCQNEFFSREDMNSVFSSGRNTLNLYSVSSDYRWFFRASWSSAWRFSFIAIRNDFDFQHKVAHPNMGEFFGLSTKIIRSCHKMSYGRLVTILFISFFGISFSFEVV